MQAVTHTPRRLLIDGRCEVEARNAQGARARLHVNAATGVVGRTPTPD